MSNKQNWVIGLLVIALVAILFSGAFYPSTINADYSTIISIDEGEFIYRSVGKMFYVSRGAIGRGATDYLVVFSGRHPGTNSDTTYVFNILLSGFYEGLTFEIYVTEGQEFYVANQCFVLDAVYADRAVIRRVS